MKFSKITNIFTISKGKRERELIIISTSMTAARPFYTVGRKFPCNACVQINCSHSFFCEMGEKCNSNNTTSTRIAYLVQNAFSICSPSTLSLWAMWRLHVVFLGFDYFICKLATCYEPLHVTCERHPNGNSSRIDHLDILSWLNSRMQFRSEQQIKISGKIVREKWIK